MSSRKAFWGATAAAAMLAFAGTASLHAQEPTTPSDSVPVTTPAEPTTPPVAPAPAAVIPVTPTVETTTPATTTRTTTVAPVTMTVSNPASITVPPQMSGPMTVGNFNAAVNNQASHLRRLRGLSNLTGSNITLIPVSKLSPSPATAGIENAVTRAEGRAASSRTAASENAAIAAALTAAGVSADAVLAIAVRGHNENDVTVYHR